MRRRILAGLVALGLAAVGCLAVLAYVRGADARALAGREAAWVLVTTRRVPAGTTAVALREQGYVERVAMPASTVPGDALGELDPRFDALAITGDVQAGQLLLRAMFGEPTRLSGGLALPEGKLAVSVEMTAAARVAGYVRPGSKVAVFDTFAVQEGKGRVPASGRSGRGGNQATRVLLPRLEVIAVGERGTAGAATSAGTPATTAQGDQGAARGGATMLITVAVTQDEAERLVHAAHTGTLYLALLDDTAKIEPGQGVDNNTIFP
ncbi:pilus assembly protein CpaB [Micromonospora pattaloongensis]|uniref:Pilus assembly protein CpaB n=1 Tax=Micromonospora pattaloongensis TaxID=405436 RepID=A0A1H3NQX0_9ACTN|nr:RcpC/CpaB family pilus assembly protein [Micromonospora pattaloongensis]SDY90845.1 pilus assembly protein CpaB [Micromonospora pattaloongensis]